MSPVPDEEIVAPLIRLTPVNAPPVVPAAFALTVRLPFTVARDAADYPFFDRDAETIEYGYWHGYAKFDREALTPRYAFGHGLSYTHFAYRALNHAKLSFG